MYHLRNIIQYITQNFYQYANVLFLYYYFFAYTIYTAVNRRNRISKTVTTNQKHEVITFKTVQCTPWFYFHFIPFFILVYMCSESCITLFCLFFMENEKKKLRTYILNLLNKEIEMVERKNVAHKPEHNNVAKSRDRKK